MYKGSEMHWTKDAGLHQDFKDYREETELLLDKCCLTSEMRKPNSNMSVYGLEKSKDVPEHS